jgi:hypothetical protein
MSATVMCMIPVRGRAEGTGGLEHAGDHNGRSDNGRGEGDPRIGFESIFETSLMYSVVYGTSLFLSIKSRDDKSSDKIPLKSWCRNITVHGSVYSRFRG